MRRPCCGATLKQNPIIRAVKHDALELTVQILECSVVAGSLFRHTVGWLSLRSICTPSSSHGQGKNKSTLEATLVCQVGPHRVAL